MDVGFVGFNTYSRPDQLPSGMLADSSNGRLGKNGEWQVRKGVNVIKAPFASGNAVLRLPTVSEETAPLTVSLLPTTIRSASLASGKVLIVIDNPAVDAGHIFAVGNTVEVEGLVGSPSPNGSHVLTAVTDNGDGTKTIEYALSGTDTTYTTAFCLPFTLVDSTTPALNGETKSSVIGFNMVLLQSSVTAVYASTTFSDPNQENSQFIILASNESAVATDLNDTSIEIKMGYPVNENIPLASSMLQAFNKIFIFRDGQTALENDNFFSPIAINSASINTTSVVTVNTLTPHNLAVGNAVTISGVTGFPGEGDPSVTDEDPNGTFKIDSVPSSTSFTYETGVGSTTAVPAYTVVSSLISPGFKLVPSGQYSQPVQLAPDTLAITNGYAVATFTGGSSLISGVKVGDAVEIESAGNSTLEAGQNFVIAEVTESPATLSFYVQEADTTGGGSTSVVFQQRISQGLGFSHMPAPEYATYHQRRLVVPFKYAVEDADDTFTYRKILDEVITSDILDSDTYDQIYGQFRFNAGTADFNVGLHSFSDDKLLVFNRNSIHLISGAGTSAKVQLITNEVGCVARQSIIQVGNNVLFLSDNGVYGANFQDLYNLRGNEVPLSSPINSIIQRINKDVWDKSVGVYFDNRYYLAVPLNEEVVTVDAAGNTSIQTTLAQVNNAILIFNFINKQWESIDTTNAPNWNISNLIVAGKKSDRAVYAVNTLGGLHRLDARVDATDVLATTIPVSGAEDEDPYAIPASVTTRQFTLGSMDRKRWNNLELHVQSSPDSESNLSISAELENIDATVDLGTLRSLNSDKLLERNEDVSVRGRIGNKRAYGMQVTLNNIAGRPRFRGVKVGGAEAFRSTNTAI